jgi:hypothetical protein
MVYTLTMPTRIRNPVLLAPVLLASVAAAAPPRTFRIDYFHTGNATEERFSLDRLVLEPLPFPGRLDRRLDDTNLGKYFFEVRDAATQELLYSRGFASIYGEWETTAEALTAHRTFSESLRFPAPGAPVVVALKKRGPNQVFREVWTLLVDPRDKFVDSAPPPPAGPTIAIQSAGDPADKLDLLLLGDGYTAGERGKCEKDVRRLVAILFERSPFKERRAHFNVWALCPPTAQSGISRPLTGIHRRSAVGATYDAFGSERYVLAFENRSLRDVASQAPYDALAIVANANTYGGGGIFNLYTTVAADSMWAGYIFVHELGHSLAALADEYFTSETAYLPTKDPPEPWEPNITTDPLAAKWKDLVAAGTPLPTPWPHDEFTKTARAYEARRRKIRAENGPESAMDALFLEQKKANSAQLSAARHAGVVGAFEGANYAPRGTYRPSVDCIMFTRDDVPFCPVCRRTLERVIDLYARR